jgi:hypothetical protein
MGSRSEKDYIFKWFDARLKPGVNSIEASAIRDGITYTDNCVWQLTETPKQSGEPNK